MLTLPLNYSAMDTIVALASSPSAHSALNIIRVSGSSTFQTVLSFFILRSGKKLKGFTHKQIEHGYFIHPDTGEKVDEVLLLPFVAPHSYTGEDSVEITCHGGNLLYKQIIDHLLASGASLAEAGEFTKRAVLNGKMDLAQAEAVQEIVAAENNLLLSLAQKNLSGSFGETLSSVSSPLFELISLLETALNFSDDVDVDIPLSLFDCIIEGLNQLLSAGAYIDDLHLENILILGEPNAGKSSLMNLLCGKEKSIVTDIAGTTRDMIEQKVEISGFHATLIDTAGLKEKTDDLIEKKGIEKALEMIPRSGLVIYLVDVSSRFNSANFQRVYDIVKAHEHLSFLLCINKIDKKPVFSADRLFTDDKEVTTLSVSVKENIAIAELKRMIEKKLSSSASLFDKSYYINKRQKELLNSALRLVTDAQGSALGGETEEITLQLLLEAADELSLITGKMTTEEMLGKVFSQFCIGK